MSFPRAFAAGFGAAAALAAAGWFLRVRPELDESAQRVRDAEEAARKSRRDAADASHWADAERGRTRELEDRIRELQRAAEGPPPPKDGMPGHDPPKPPEEPAPETWDRQRLGREIEMLAVAPATIGSDPRFPKVLRAMKTHRDETVEMFTQVLGGEFPKELVQTVCALSEPFGDVGLKPALLLRLSREQDPDVRAPLLRALVVLPGNEVVPDLVVAWKDPASDDRLRSVAIRGLALRGHEVARHVAAGGVEGVQPGVRMRALESLREFAQREGWIDTALVPVFGKALLTADGDHQRRMCLLGLEGLWVKEALPDLEKFAADPGTDEDLAARARKIADGIRSGAPRPAGAGVPERATGPR